jgi:hypothetical protein
MAECISCGDPIRRHQTIELSGVSERSADKAFESLCEGEKCADCIVADLAFEESMEADWS